tara:strand:- start:107 stop:1021 length:915 start_codon:yes stop_codon:yes gene_type:complete
MGGILEYGPKDSTAQTLFTMFCVSGLSILAFIYWDVFSLVEGIASTFHSSWAPLEVLIAWRFICFFIGLSAVIHMFKSGAGIMIVILHDEREEVILYPVGFEKFVTFSSWTLLMNILYFLCAGIISVSVLNGSELPMWLNIAQVILFSSALGASLLTATVVRYIIIPGEVRIGRNHDQMFNFPNQMMHNVAAIFLIADVILVQPELFPHFLLFGMTLGTIYALFAYFFAFFGGGYYIYSFIDPRLRYGPIWLSGLALAIALFYLGVWFGIQVMSYNFWIGSVLFVLWVSLIVQFRTTLPEPVSE